MFLKLFLGTMSISLFTAVGGLKKAMTSRIWEQRVRGRRLRPGSSKWSECTKKDRSNMQQRQTNEFEFSEEQWNDKLIETEIVMNFILMLVVLTSTSFFPFFFVLAKRVSSELISMNMNLRVVHNWPMFPDRNLQVINISFRISDYDNMENGKRATRVQGQQTMEEESCVGNHLNVFRSSEIFRTWAETLQSKNPELVRWKILETIGVFQELFMSTKRSLTSVRLFYSIKSKKCYEIQRCEMLMQKCDLFIKF